MRNNLQLIPALSGILMLLLVGARPAGAEQNNLITELSCDAIRRCPGHLECYSFPDIGLRCAPRDPCSYFQCPPHTRCVLAESYPAQVICACDTSDCKTTRREKSASVLPQTGGQGGSFRGSER